MWSAGSDAQVYLGSTMALCRLSAREDPIQVATSSWMQSIEAIESRLSPQPARLRFWLSARLARPFLLQSVPGIRNREEAVRMAEAVAAEACGLDRDCQVWLGRWSPGQASLAVAVERQLVDELHAVGARLKCRVAAISPWWNAVLSQRLVMGPPPGLLCVHEPDGMTVLGIGDELVRLAQSHDGALSPDRQWAQLLRLAVSQGVDRAQIDRAQFSDAPVEGNRCLPVGSVTWLGAEA